MSRKAKYKILLLGEGTVGKTTLKHYYLTGAFTSTFTMTLGADFATHNFYFKEFDTDVTIVIWDVAGQKYQARLRESFYSHSRGALILYDVTNKATFDAIEENWLEPLERILKSKPPLLMCANKVDLINERVISTDQGKEFASYLKEEKNWDIQYIETSAKDGKNVKNAFENLTAKILNT